MTLTIAPISSLFARGGPSNIARLVAAIVVDAIQRCAEASRLGANVRNECIKATHPFLTHPDSTPAVVFVVPNARIRAAISCVLPCLVFWFGPAATEISMAESRFGCGKSDRMFTRGAPTRPSATSAEVAPANDAHTTAITTTFPSAVARGRLRWNLGQNHKTAKALSEHVDFVASRSANPHGAILSRACLQAGT